MSISSFEFISGLEDSEPKIINSLAQVDSNLFRKSPYIHNSCFVKSWQQVQGHDFLHLFYNHRLQAFWALLQDLETTELIPPTQGAFQIIKVPMLDCETGRKKMMQLINFSISSPLVTSFIEVLRRELRHPVVRGSSNCYSIELKSKGLLGGGAKVSRTSPLISSPQGTVEKGGSNHFNEVRKFLIERYEIPADAGNTNDKRLVEALARLIYDVVPADQYSTISNFVSLNITAYEEEFLRDAVLKVLGKSRKDGNPALTDYTRNFESGMLTIELLRKGFFANQRAKGGIDKVIIDRVLTKLEEEIQPLIAKIENSTKPTAKGQPGDGLERYFVILEKKEKAQSIMNTVSKSRVKKMLSIIRERLNIESDHKQDIIDELCFSPEYDSVITQLIVKFSMTSKTSMSFSPLRGQILDGLRNSSKISSDISPSPLDPDSSPGLVKKLRKAVSEAEPSEVPDEKEIPDLSYLDKVQLSVLSEMNMLDHDVSTLVQLFNMLKLDQEIKNQGLDLEEAKDNMAKHAKLNDIKSLLMAMVRTYREDEETLDSAELSSLLPLSFVQDKEVFRAFLEAFLFDLKDDILIEPKKIRMLSFILINAMRNKDFKNFCTTDDLIQCLRIIIPKIEDLSITSENLNLQEVMNSLNDVLYLMGFIGAKGVKGEYSELITQLTHHMQSHSLEKAFNLVTGKGKDISLEIKREYSIEAFKRIEGTSYDEWADRLEKIIQVSQIAISLGKGVFTSNLADITDALLQAKDLLVNEYMNSSKTWFDDANNLRFQVQEPMEKILSQLFDESQKGLTSYYVFYIAEFLLGLVNRPERKVQEKKLAIQALWLLSNGYDYREFNGKYSPVKSKAYKANKDLLVYVKKNLLNIGQNSNIDLNLFIRKIVESPIGTDLFKVLTSDPLSASNKAQQDINQAEESSSKKFYLRVLREKTPKLYALANIQEHSEKTFEKPPVLVGYRVVEREKDFDDAFKTKLIDMLANAKPANLEPGVQQIQALDPKATTKKKLQKMIETIGERPEGPAPKETPEDKKVNTEKREKLQNELCSKIEEIINSNTAEIFDVLENFLDDPLKRVLVIQGDAGAGKTMLVRLFEHKLWKRYNISLKADVKNRGRLPLRIVLSEVRSLKSAIDDFLRQNGCDSEGLREIKRKPTAIIFDGYDEINQWVNLYNLNNLQMWKDVKVIFTSRKENLTALKEDYIYCFTPGRDVAKVGSYIIQPVNEDQIRQYFREQAAENDNEAFELEKKLRQMQGSSSSFSPLTDLVTKEVDYFKSFTKSDEYSCICNILSWLEQHTEDIIQLEEEIAALEDDKLQRISLSDALSKRVDALQNLADKDYINSMQENINKKLPQIKKVEAFLDEIMNSPDFLPDTQSIVMKLKKPMPPARVFRVLERMPDSLTSYSYTGLELQSITTDWLDLINSRANKTYFEETCQIFRKTVKVCQDLAERMKTCKDLNISAKEKLLDTSNLETLIREIETFSQLEKIETAAKALQQQVGDCESLQAEFEALIKETETPENFIQDLTRLKAHFDKCKSSLTEIRKRVEKFEAATTDVRFTSFSSSWEVKPVWEYEFYMHYYDPKMTGPEFSEIRAEYENTYYGDFEVRLQEFAIFLSTNTLDQVTWKVSQASTAVNEILTRLAIKTLIQITNEIKKETELLTSFKAENRKGSRLVHALLDQKSKLVSLNHDYQYSNLIHRLEETALELKNLDNEAMAIKVDFSENMIRMMALSKQITDLKRFSDSNSVDGIIKKFRDVVSSPFMLRMLAQTLIKHPRSLANKAELYHLFSNIHFEREKERLMKTENIPSKFNIMDSFYQYSKDLAVNMFIRKITSLQVKSSGYKTLGIVENEKKNIWSRFFDDTQIITKLSRRGAQIIEDDSVIRFTHKSIMEYFAARQFYDEIVDYNPDSPDDFDPCLNKGPIIDNETAVYQFIKDIGDSQTKKDETLSVFDKKLFEILGSTAVQKLYKDALDQNFLFPNIFLVLLLRENTKSKINELREGSPVTVVLNGILNWLFNPPQESQKASQKFLKMLDQAHAVSSQSVSILEQILPLYYHSITPQLGQASPDDKFVIEKKNVGVKVRLCSEDYIGSFIVKDEKVVKDESSESYSWILEGKLFLHGSQESIVILKTKGNDKCFSLDTAKAKSPEISTDFTLNDVKTAWNVMESKWTMRMNNYERVSFQLISIADPTKTLFGRFEKIEDYKSVFVNLCSTDIHTCSVSDQSYHCITCGLDKGGKIMCKSCLDICHKGHETAEYGPSGGYCDCRFAGVCKVALGCTKRFSGGYQNFVMFKCTQCPKPHKNTILCNGCMVHHKKETQHENFEKINESLECECDCISSRTQVIAKTQSSNYYSGYEEENVFQHLDSDSEKEDDHHD